ncbi:SRPBCC family protein [Fodinicurvata halophila]|uniref:SRPBCC family protein n=1 Tax=Fodinicurvata halophila TaxID=1419723 RepID=A0ABV8UHW8_9PROT
MQIQNSFEVPVDPQTAWTTLLDIPAIAPCMPGARILEVKDEDTYKGEVQVRLGPMVLSFQGTGQIVEKDEANHNAKVKAQGRDTKGRGNASADIAFHLVPLGDGTRVDITTDLNLSGSVAQYGRSSGMISDLANHLVGEFASNLRQKLNEDTDPAPATAENTGSETMDAPASPARNGANSGADLEAKQGMSQDGRTETSQDTRPLSGISLFIMLIKGWFRRTFGAAK